MTKQRQDVYEHIENQHRCIEEQTERKLKQRKVKYEQSD